MTRRTVVNKVAEKLFKGEIQHVYEASPKSLNFPPEIGTEVAFIGRSNVGKSSLLNAITNRKELARTSQTPGRTQGIQFFQVPENFFLVDLPGYGYAKLSKSLVAQIDQLVETYFNERRNLKRVFVVVDARHGLKDSDRSMLQFLGELGLTAQVVLTKLDKLRGAQKEIAVKKVAADVADMPSVMDVMLPVSSVARTGLEDVRAAVLEAWEG